MDIVVSLFLLSVVGAFVQRTTGFGFGIFMMTMLPALMPSYGEATALSGLLSMSMSSVVAYRLRKYVTWRRMGIMLIAFTVFATFAIFGLSLMNDHTIRVVLGVVLVVISLYFALFSSRIHLRATPVVQGVIGSISGVMGGLFGMHGAPAALFFVSSEPTKQHYMAMCQAYFTMGNVLMSLVRWQRGYFTATVFVDYLYGIGGVVVGLLVGMVAYRYIPSRLLRYLVYAYIGISGLFILFG